MAFTFRSCYYLVVKGFSVEDSGSYKKLFKRCGILFEKGNREFIGSEI
ncbi:hypothetical protein T190130A13A_10408 [Tenacibaculum sp. 190130A14a]